MSDRELSVCVSLSVCLCPIRGIHPEVRSSRQLFADRCGLAGVGRLFCGVLRVLTAKLYPRRRSLADTRVSRGYSLFVFQCFGTFIAPVCSNALYGRWAVEWTRRAVEWDILFSQYLGLQPSFESLVMELHVPKKFRQLGTVVDDLVAVVCCCCCWAISTLPPIRCF